MTWDTPLAEPIVLERGKTRFQTLRDAATFLQRRYRKAKGGVLAGTLRDLMAAAENPTEDAVQRATFQFARFLHDENLIRTLPAATHQGDDLEFRIREMMAGRGQFRRTALYEGIMARRKKPKR